MVCFSGGASRNVLKSLASCGMMQEKKNGVTITMSVAAEQPALPLTEEEQQRADTTVILSGTTVSGELYGADNVLIEGTFLGGIRVKGTVTVAGSGVVKGPIEAEDVSVAGTVTGDIAARATLRLEMTGSITGDVTMRTFTIEDGGCFDGRSHMTALGAEPVILYREPEQPEQEEQG